MDKGQSIRSLERCDQRGERTSMECCHGNQQRLLSGKLTGNAAGRSNDTDPGENLFNLAARQTQCGAGQKAKPACGSEHTENRDDVGGLSGSLAIQGRRQDKAEARIKEIWTDERERVCVVCVCVCVRERREKGRGECG